MSVSRDFRSMTFFFIYQPITDIAFEFVTMLDSTLNNLDFEELKMTHKSCSGIFHYELYAKYEHIFNPIIPLKGTKSPDFRALAFHNSIPSGLLIHTLKEL